MFRSKSWEKFVSNLKDKSNISGVRFLEMIRALCPAMLKFPQKYARILITIGDFDFDIFRWIIPMELRLSVEINLLLMLPRCVRTYLFFSILMKYSDFFIKIYQIIIRFLAHSLDVLTSMFNLCHEVRTLVE